ncbi:hypothetical protein [Hippea maritima]|uniref:Putative cytoplasmic protein n=1 Tax=Hippea maritima (strain ATCC 700847 / DSM 10411 / MH2) TaxID=760142 RepID=F2LXI9_HIPMA|nr:hypothetical protein [Hippea maritima]AEA33175.1 putative cytoplasmic protein [Hippea maritima DSM 10411]
MVGPIDIQNVILNATAQSQLNQNPLSQAAAADTFKGLIEKKEKEEKTTKIEEAENHPSNTIEKDKQEQKRRAKTKDGHIDLKA